MVKLTIKSDSSLSHINIHYFSKMPKTIGQRAFSKKQPQKTEYLKNFCYDLNKPFQFAFRNIKNNQYFEKDVLSVKN